MSQYDFTRRDVVGATGVAASLALLALRTLSNASYTCV